MAKLRLRDGREATLTADGDWESPDAVLAEQLNAAFAPQPTVVGSPAARAFTRAVDLLGAEVLDPPDEPASDGLVH